MITKAFQESSRKTRKVAKESLDFQMNGTDFRKLQVSIVWIFQIEIYVELNSLIRVVSNQIKQNQKIAHYREENSTAFFMRPY